MVSFQILTKFISYLDGTTWHLANQTVFFLIGCYEISDFLGRHSYTMDNLLVFHARWTIKNSLEYPDAHVQNSSMIKEIERELAKIA